MCTVQLSRRMIFGWALAVDQHSFSPSANQSNSSEQHRCMQRRPRL
jgi:hypothetical protein